MNLKELHEYFGALLAAGIDPTIPVVCLNEGWPKEIHDALGLDGEFYGDPAPQMSSFRPMKGQMLALVPLGEDQSELLNPRPDTHIISHTEIDLPVKPPYR